MSTQLTIVNHWTLLSLKPQRVRNNFGGSTGTHSSWFVHTSCCAELHANMLSKPVGSSNMRGM
eukprot:1470247-Amphidinium_carterae.2